MEAKKENGNYQSIMERRRRGNRMKRKRGTGGGGGRGLGGRREKGE